MERESITILQPLPKPDAKGSSLQQHGSAHLRMSGENARTIIINCHSMLRNKFRGAQLWSMVGHITGHGSGYSAEICKTANLDPMQPCGVKQLRDYSPNNALRTSRENEPQKP